MKIDQCQHKRVVDNCLPCLHYMIKKQGIIINNLINRYEKVHDFSDDKHKQMMFEIDKEIYLVKP